MKRFLILLTLLFCNVVFADIINLRFVNEDNTIYENKTCTVGGDVILPSTTPSKRGYNFVGWEIPQYIPIEYLKNVASKTYIDTGYIADNNTKIVAIFDKVSTNTNKDNGCPIFGIEVKKGNATKGIIIQDGWKNSALPYITLIFDSITNRFQRPNVSILKIALDKEGYSINDGTINKFSYNSAFSDGSLLVFANSSSEISNCTNRIYSLQIYQNDILVHDYVPALDLAGVAGLYDKADNVFLYNAGTGEFVAGPIVSYD